MSEFPLSHFELVIDESKIENRKDLSDGHTVMIDNIGHLHIYNRNTGKRLAKVSSVDELSKFLEEVENN